MLVTSCGGVKALQTSARIQDTVFLVSIFLTGFEDLRQL